MIIVNDLTGKVTLSDEEWGMISELVKSDNTYNLFYLGNEDIDQLLRTEVISSLSMWEGRDLSIAVTHEGPDVITVFGTYYENAGFSLPEAILAEQVFSIRQSNQGMHKEGTRCPLCCKKEKDYDSGGEDF